MGGPCFQKQMCKQGYQRRYMCTYVQLCTAGTYSLMGCAFEELPMQRGQCSLPHAASTRVPCLIKLLTCTSHKIKTCTTFWSTHQHFITPISQEVNNTECSKTPVLQPSLQVTTQHAMPHHVMWVTQCTLLFDDSQLHARLATSHSPCTPILTMPSLVTSAPPTLSPALLSAASVPSCRRLPCCCC